MPIAIYIAIWEFWPACLVRWLKFAEKSLNFFFLQCIIIIIIRQHSKNWNMCRCCLFVPLCLTYIILGRNHLFTYFDVNFFYNYIPSFSFLNWSTLWFLIKIFFLNKFYILARELFLKLVKPILKCFQDKNSKSAEVAMFRYVAKSFQILQNPYNF